MKEFLYRLRWKIQKFMQGRNGVDELNRILLYAVLVLFGLCRCALFIISYPFQKFVCAPRGKSQVHNLVGNYSHKNGTA